MHKVVKICLISTAIFTIVACSSLRFPGVYKVRVQQGNYIEKKMVDQLEKGMTRSQVRYVMGTPLLEDTFNGDRWDYLFIIKRGDKVLTDRRFTVFFEGDSLTHWETDIEFSDASEKEVEKAQAADKREDVQSAEPAEETEEGEEE